MKKLKYLLLLCVLALSACQISKDPDPVAFAYDSFGIDLPKGVQLYLGYNLWFTDPMNIDCINYQEGRILNFGTPIDIIKAEDGLISFQVKGVFRVYTIRNDYGRSLLKDPQFFGAIFVQNNPMDKFSKTDKTVMDSMLNGKVTLNMTRDEVYATYGPPPKSINPISQITWTYFMTRELKTIHVVFQNDKVAHLFEN